MQKTIQVFFEKTKGTISTREEDKQKEVFWSFEKNSGIDKNHQYLFTVKIDNYNVRKEIIQEYNPHKIRSNKKYYVNLYHNAFTTDSDIATDYNHHVNKAIQEDRSGWYHLDEDYHGCLIIDFATDSVFLHFDTYHIQKVIDQEPRRLSAIF